MYLARNAYPANTPPFVEEFTVMAAERRQRELAAFEQVKAKHPGSAAPQIWEHAYETLLPNMPSALQQYGYETARDASDWWTLQTHFLNEAESRPIFDLKDAGEIIEYRERKETSGDRLVLEGDERYVKVFSYLSKLADRKIILMNGLADPFALEAWAWQIYGCTAVDLALAAHGTGTNRDSELAANVGDPALGISRIAVRRILLTASSTNYNFVLTDDQANQHVHTLTADQAGIHAPRGQFDIATAQLIGSVFEINPSETWKRARGSMEHMLPAYAAELTRRPQIA